MIVGAEDGDITKTAYPFINSMAKYALENVLSLGQGTRFLRGRGGYLRQMLEIPVS